MNIIITGSVGEKMHDPVCRDYAQRKCQSIVLPRNGDFVIDRKNFFAYN